MYPLSLSRSSIAPVTTRTASPGKAFSPGEALGGGEQADRGHRVAPRSHSTAIDRDQRAAGGEHRVEHEHLAAVRPAGSRFA